ncbi:MAG TPA: hypothetical protein GX717_08400 [Clostridiaceae bacterium]|nr:hypothetical protein [Clostridiaceae bacterium]
MANQFNKKVKTTLVMVLTFVIMLVLSACGGNKVEQVAADLGLSGIEGRVVSASSFREGSGYAMTFTAIDVKDSGVLNEIKESDDWRELPMSDQLEVGVYGASDGKNVLPPRIHDSDGAPVFPRVDKGYYRVIDLDYVENNDEETKGPDYDYIMAIYDSDKDKLFYAKFTN